MVQYHEWIQIASEVARLKYGSPTFEEASGNVSVFARLWNQNKARLKEMDESEAAEFADDRI